MTSLSHFYVDENSILQIKDPKDDSQKRTASKEKCYRLGKPHMEIFAKAAKMNRPGYKPKLRLSSGKTTNEKTQYRGDYLSGTASPVPTTPGPTLLTNQNLRGQP